MDETTDLDSISEPSRAPAGLRAWRLVGAAVVLGGIALGVTVAGAGRWLDPATWASEGAGVRAFAAERPALAAVFWVLAHGGLAAVSAPGAVWLCLAAGLVFGAGLGALYGWLGLVIGSLAAFLAMRLLGGRGGADAGASPTGGARRAAARRALARHGGLAVVLLRLSPVPYFLVTFAAAAFGMTLRGFAGATAVGFAPGAFAYAALGAGAGTALMADPGNVIPALLADPWTIAGVVALGLMAVGGVLAARSLKPDVRSGPTS